MKPSEKAEQEEVKIYNFKDYDVANGFKLARYVTVFFFTLFLLAMLFIFKDDMTIDHFKYLIRNLEFNPKFVFSVGDEVYYDSDEESEFVSYKGGIAVLGDQKISLYDMSSSATLSEYHGYKKPVICSSDKYMLVFDRQSNNYSVYNAFNELKTFKTESPVIHAAVSDNGAHAVSMMGDDYYSTIYVYNSNFVCVNKIQKYKYVMGLDFSENGDILLITTAYVNELGEYTTEIMLLEVGKETAQKTITLNSMMAWDCRFFSNGSFVMVSDVGMRFYDKKGVFEASCVFGEEKPSNYLIQSDNVLLFYKDSALYNKNTLVVYNKNGRKSCEVLIEGEFIDVCASSKQAYVLLNGSVAIVSTVNGDIETVLVEANARSILLGNNEEVYLCYFLKACKLNR